MLAAPRWPSVVHLMKLRPHGLRGAFVALHPRRATFTLVKRVAAFLLICSAHVAFSAFGGP
eukprot:7345498-Pyramimonas_sp.AAC.1